MQQLRDKLAITERAAKSEAQLKVMICFSVNADFMVFFFGVLKVLCYVFRRSIICG